MKRISILSFLSMLVTATSAWSQANTTAAGTPLSQGVVTANTDGMLIQLGYYSAATAGNNFAGTWIPITGFGSALHTSIGDTSDLSGAGDGIGDFVASFGGAFLSTTSVQVYPGVPPNPGTYVTQSSVPITTTQPPNNQIMSIRFYDTTTGTSGNYNAVSANDWLWAVPTTAGGGATVSFSLSDAFQGVTAALLFEASGAGNDFRTVIPVPIPEPSTFALLGLGALGVVVGNRRRSKAVA
jgi:hypothetical protein